MIKDIKDLKKGDILLYKPKGLDPIGRSIAFFSLGGKYSHASVYVGNGNIIESHLTTGVHKLKLNKKYFQSIDVYRCPHLLSEDDTVRLLNWYHLQLGKKYDLGAFPSTFLKSVVAKIFGFKNFRKSRPLLNDDDIWYCSELASTGYYQTLGINVVPGLHPMSQTPSDLAKGIFCKIY